jgi:hypothetical protein
MPFAPGTCLGPYEIPAIVGIGGTGEVYKAHDTRLARTVALKILPAQFAADPERRRPFEQEARAASALEHPHINVLDDIGCDCPVLKDGPAPPDLEPAIASTRPRLAYTWQVLNQNVWRLDLRMGGRHGTTGEVRTLATLDKDVL